jgi:superfamily II DNA helicase RecQ
MTKRFHDYVEGLRVMAQLDGFVFDEAHTILEGTRDFRPKLRELGRLALVGVQMVYLTATLPPSKEAELFELINARSEDVTMIRTSTTRANVVYCVQTLTATTPEQATEAVTIKVREVLDRKLEESSVLLAQLHICLDIFIDIFLDIFRVVSIPQCVGCWLLGVLKDTE